MLQARFPRLILDAEKYASVTARTCRAQTRASSLAVRTILASEGTRSRTISFSRLSSSRLSTHSSSTPGNRRSSTRARCPIAIRVASGGGGATSSLGDWLEFITVGHHGKRQPSVDVCGERASSRAFLRKPLDQLLGTKATDTAGCPLTTIRCVNLDRFHRVDHGHKPRRAGSSSRASNTHQEYGEAA